MATVFAVMHQYNPKRVAICKGYHITHKALNLWYKEDFATRVVGFDVELQPGDLVWLETPRNPTCEIVDLELWGKKVSAAGATLVVDSTFASPVLQKPLSFAGVDVVMQSCTKYLSGHDDVLCGALITKDEKVAEQLNATRTILGSVPGNLECFLLLRSIRTLTLRVEHQSKAASRVAAFLHGHRLVKVVYHPSLPSDPNYELCRKQMKGPPGILSVEFVTADVAQQVMKRLQLFTQATSLGGTMSLVDWRYARDKTQPEALLRVSVGLEDPIDLIADWKQALAV
jgi:cystathionine gamma-synthase